jgi:branched-subunit amino acid transport protein AzlD
MNTFKVGILEIAGLVAHEEWGLLLGSTLLSIRAFMLVFMVLVNTDP